MKNVTDLKVTQIRIFPVDVIPLSVITTKTCVEKIRQTLSTGEPEVLSLMEGKNILVFRRGELRKEFGIIIVTKIEVDPRRVIVDVEGTSKEAEEVYEVFLSAISSAANVNVEDLRKPLLLAEATQCVVSMDFTLDSMFNNKFIEFLSQKVEKEASNEIAKASVRPLAAIAEITYEITNKALVDNKIAMNPKQFSIAPRPGTPSEARRYLISSPFDSDSHLKLIKDLNKRFRKSKNK